MQTVKCMVVLFILVLLAACSGDNVSPQPQTERTWFWDHELTGANAQIANEYHTVVLRLKPDAAAGGETLKVLSIPYTYKKTGRYEYCIRKDDPYFVSMTITGSDGKAVANVQQGACVQADISAGSYTVAVTHKRLAAYEKERLAFLGVPRTIRLAGQNGSVTSGSVDLLSIGKLAIADDHGRLLTLSSNQPAKNGHENYYLVSVPMRQITSDDLFSFVSPGSPAFLYTGYALATSKGWLGSFYNGTMLPNIDSGYLDCDLRLAGPRAQVQSPLYTYSVSIDDTPANSKFILADLGNYAFNLFTSDIYAPVGMSSGGNQMTSACTTSLSGATPYKTKFTVLFRYYDDSSQMTALQQGEVALFEKPNYTGRVWIFAKDQPNLAQLTTDVSAARSVKTGPNTRVALYDISTGLRNVYTGYGIDDLAKTSLQGGIGPLQIAPDVSKINLGTESCHYCDLTGITHSGFYIDFLDVTGGNISNSTFEGSQLNLYMDNALASGSVFRMKYSKYCWPGEEAGCEDYYPMFLGTARNAILDGATMTGDSNGLPLSADFTSVSMKHATVTNVTFYALQSNSDLSGSTLSNVNLLCNKGLDLSACFSNGTLILHNIITDKFVLTNLADNPQNCRYLDVTSATFNAPLTLSGKLGGCSFKSVTFNDKLDVTAVKQPCSDMNSLTGCADFSGSILTKAAMNGATLHGAIFDGATLVNADFSDALLRQASFKNAISKQSTDTMGNQVTMSKFSRAQMNNANLSNAALNYVTFRGANLSNANLSNGSFYGAQFNTDTSALQKQTVLDGAYLQNTNMASADLTNASMRNASFHSKYPLATNGCLPDSNKKTSGCASAYKAILVGTNLTNAYLAGLDLSSATLYGANFANSTLMGANFSNAVVKANQGAQPNTSFQGAVLYGANFTNVSLLNTNLGGAYFDNPATTQGYSTGGMLVSYLDTNYTSFPGSSYEGKPVCVKYQPSSVTKQNAFPGTDASSTCPDQSSGPCLNNSQWLAATPLDLTFYVLTYNYTGNSDPPPAPARCSSVVYW